MTSKSSTHTPNRELTDHARGDTWQFEKCHANNARTTTALSARETDLHTPLTVSFAGQHYNESYYAWSRPPHQLQEVWIYPECTDLAVSTRNFNAGEKSFSATGRELGFRSTLFVPDSSTASQVWALFRCAWAGMQLIGAP